MKQLIFGGALAATMTLISPQIAQAEDKAPELRGDEVCAKVGMIPEYGRTFAKLKADKTDTVRMLPAAVLKLEEGGGKYPDRFFIRDQGIEKDLTIAPDGQVTDFAQMLQTSDDVELCAYDPARAGIPLDEDGIELDMDMDIQFLNRTGMHDMAELKDGLKDGKSHYKKMAGAMSFLVPKLSYVMIEPVNEDTPPSFAPVKAGQVLEGLSATSFCDLPMVKVKDLEEMGADGLQITGAYTLLPVPGPKTLAKFASCDGDDDEGAPREE